MKIAVPSEGKQMDSPVNRSFGRTPCFIVADTETGDFKVIDNEAAAAQGGAGIKAAQTIVDSGAGAVVTFHCGENAAEVLNAAGIRLWKAVPGTVADMADAWKNGTLAELSEIHAGYHGHG
ncbi:NifB/NifX family molybdenum-iron cluster-binding protein [Caproicibacter fermentans]|uniref:NifB/NifX family molybdenum-iron cluster-binding protein n=1 Tax=Caproicibacter fermentans TaxID=2576756 RepID=A0A7G8TAE0_9FIRM|nr:NifB/NifX family molybdenum-iron cluster-binding protein [Caproicibacter fermentans]QNK40581.1 NifB/NifX family molybdenum-iron cluster-binding protein [Caproicibacter fermentans]